MESKLGKQISIIYRCSQQYYDRMLKGYGLGSGQYLYLFHLLKNDGVTQQQLSDLVNVDKTTTARMVGKLITAGYVERLPSPDDKRAYNLHATARAYAMQDELHGIMRGWNELLLDGLDLGERAAVKKLMDKVGANALHFAQGKNHAVAGGEQP